MRSLNTNKVFVSVYRTGCSAEQNDAAHARALDLIRSEGFSCRVVTGVWKGQTERTILLESTDILQHQAHLNAALFLGRMFRQEAVLEVENDGWAVLHTLETGRLNVAGMFREVSRDQALSHDSYTYDEASNRYFAVV